MNKRENVRAAVDLHCLGLSPSQAQAGTSAQPEATQPPECELEQQLSEESGTFASAGGGLLSEQRQSRQAPGPEAAGHLASGTLSGLHFSDGPSSFSDVPESPSETPLARRSSRFRPSQFGLSGSAVHSELPESEHPPSAGLHSHLYKAGLVIQAGTLHPSCWPCTIIALL